MTVVCSTIVCLHAIIYFRFSFHIRFTHSLVPSLIVCCRIKQRARVLMHPLCAPSAHRPLLWSTLWRSWRSSVRIDVSLLKRAETSPSRGILSSTNCIPGRRRQEENHLSLQNQRKSVHNIDKCIMYW